MAVPGSFVVHREPFLLVEGPVELSFCHFIGGFQVAETAKDCAIQVREVAETRPGLWVFCMTGDCPPGLGSAFESVGFSVRQVLDQLVDQSPETAPVLEPATLEVTALSERASLGLFMAEQFFTRAGATTRVSIASATAGSCHRLYGWKDDDGWIAGAMLCATPGVFGLYNLCVRSEARSRGWGSFVLDQMRAVARSEGRFLALQSSADLAGWYLRRSFGSVGELRAYSLVETLPASYWP